jgi:Sigma-70 factor, region 1.1
MAVLIDLADGKVCALLERAKAAGVITGGEFHSIVGSGEVTPDDIEDTLAALAQMGIALSDDLTQEDRDEEIYSSLQAWNLEGRTIPQLTGEAWASILRVAARKKTTE